jgi:hypothetical protein
MQCRQADALRARPTPSGGARQGGWAPPDFGEDDFEALPTRGSAPPDLVRTISRPLPTRGAIPLSNQLGGREPIVRRTDLGAKGIYYRAIVGPFASMEKAAGMCRTLRQAGLPLYG